MCVRDPEGLRVRPGDGQSACRVWGRPWAGDGFPDRSPTCVEVPEPGATLGKGRDSLEPPALAGSESGGPSLAGRWLLLCGPQAWVWPSAPHRSPHWLCVPQKPPGEKPGSPRPPRAAPPPPPQVEKSLQRIQNGQRNAMYTSQQSVENKVGGTPGWQALLTAVGFRLDPPASGLPAAVFFPTSDPGDRLQQCSSTIQSLLGEPRPAARAAWGAVVPAALGRGGAGVSGVPDADSSGLVLPSVTPSSAPRGVDSSGSNVLSAASGPTGPCG